MTDTLLGSLRDHVLDESQPLAGLLRKCLLLGAETGSDALREWARKELNGYGDDDDVPEYRRVTDIPISMNSISGYTWSTGQVLNRYQLPSKAREYAPETIHFKQPIEEIEQLAARKSLSFSSPGLAMAMAVWNRELGFGQTVTGLSYTMSGSTFAGMLGQIRTKLVDLVADLTADRPLSELPRKDQVDAAVNHRIMQARDVYHTTIHEAGGPVAIGTGAKANTEGLTVADALRLLDEVQQIASETETDNRADLLEVVAELRTAVEQEAPDTGDVVKKIGKLRTIANKIGVPSIVAAVGGAAQVLTELALSGAFH